MVAALAVMNARRNVMDLDPIVEIRKKATLIVPHILPIVEIP
jgi:hypothetical protein